MSSRVPCKYYKQGRCNKGNNCPFSHGNNGYNNSYSNNSNNNSYNNNNNHNNNNSNSAPFWSPSLLDSKETEIRQDLNDHQHFQAIAFSAYSLTKAPVNLISNRDISVEELRMEYMTNPQQYEQQFQARTNDYQKVLSFLKRDTRKAARYLQTMAEHALKNNGAVSNVKPFVDFELDLSNTGKRTGDLFGNNSAAFGQTLFGVNNSNNNSTNGRSANSLFGTSGFGNATSSQPSFGASTFGASSGAPAFGSTGFGSAAKPAFGSSAFGASPADGSSAFGSLVAKTGSAFGSAIPTTNISAFGGAIPTTNKSAFGAAVPSTNTSAFGSSGFGSTPLFGSSSSPTSNSAFGQSGFGSTQPAASAFRTFDSQKSSPFGSLLTNGDAKSSPFGSLSKSDSNLASPFGSLQTSTSPFGNVVNVNTQLASSPFGATFSSTASKSGNGSSASPFGNVPSQTSNNSPFASLENGGLKTSPFGGVTVNKNMTDTANLPKILSPQTFGDVPSNNTVVPASSTSRSESLVQSPSKGKGEIEENKIQVYSVLDEITEMMGNLFEAERFILGKVPEIAPPFELC